MFYQLLAARGRGAARLIEGLYNGDPTAWSIVIGIVVLMVGWWGLKAYFASRSQSSETNG